MNDRTILNNPAFNVVEIDHENMGDDFSYEVRNPHGLVIYKTESNGDPQQRVVAMSKALGVAEFFNGHSPLNS